MTWFNYLAPIVIGTLLVSVGFLFIARVAIDFVHSNRGIRRTLLAILLSSVFFIFVVAGLFTIVVSLALAPTPSEARRASFAVFRVSPDQIAAVEIRPYDNEAYGQLVASTVVIRDPAKIATICQAMASADDFSPNHPNSLWSCFLVIKTRARTLTCEVQGTSNNGILLEAVSDVGPWRVGYGTYQSNGLGPVLKSLVTD